MHHLHYTYIKFLSSRRGEGGGMWVGVAIWVGGRGGGGEGGGVECLDFCYDI
jgi:hypothetical protein